MPPDPLADIFDDLGQLAWTDDALCVEFEALAHFWFHKGGAGAKLARQVCSACLVRAECLEFAVDHEIEHGIWGGTTEQGRRRVLSS